jgi:hypothetical protein
MERDFEERYLKHLEWNRDTNGRLYYVLWALFLGGFAYSLKLHRAEGCYQALGIVAFRALAIVGCVVNFFYQENGIDSVGQLQQQLMRTAKYLWLRNEAKLSKDKISQEEFQRTIRAADEEESKAKRHEYQVEIKDQVGARLHVSLLAITSLYLALALLLSFAFYLV